MVRQMKSMSVFLILILGVVIFTGCQSSVSDRGDEELKLKKEKEEFVFEVNKTEEEWKEILTPEQFNILRKKGTERAFTGEYNDNKKAGLYVCPGCGQELFHSEAKFDSGTGWPSFWEPVSEKKVLTRPDNSLFTRRTEVICGRCGGHLGHVFEDGPPPTGLRYCLNSLALDFQEGKENPSEKTEG